MGQDTLVPGCHDRVKFGSRAGRVGLKNLGNSCFMNAGLQCLLHVEPLVAYFLNQEYKQEVNKTSPLSYKGELAKAFGDLVRSTWQSEQKAFDPRTFRRMIAQKAPHLIDGDEQDVQEFLAFCIDGLHEDLNRVPKPPKALSKDEDKADEKLSATHGDDFAAALGWLRHLQRDKSFLVDLLQGQLRSSLTCSKCSYTSKRFDPFLYLSLPVAKSMTQVTDAIAQYLEAEHLTGDEQWHCEKCKKKVDATKKIDLWKLPPVLVLHLKRFEFDPKTQKFEKTDNRLNMKLQGLDLQEFCSSPQRDGSIYNVAGVANHSGVYGNGHYTATCRTGGRGSGTWYHFCDSNVKEYSGRHVVTRESYVIFLVRNQDVKQMSKSEKSSHSRITPLMRRQCLSRPDAWPHSEESVVQVLKATGLAGKETDTENGVATAARISGVARPSLASCELPDAKRQKTEHTQSSITRYLLSAGNSK
eukprot:TRINITY_DN82304_c0_g1_i1.p1 TRINITY_DN82304_c0_g1~~TRINITY_DN82304_c0_g1_i1.p1  ORF type:complete len:471 (-),score=84.71 TRINITY_DN82304_c0_g1_i1:145-1557(-)